MIGIGLYVRNSVLAVEVYKEAFNLELGYHVLNEDGTFFHSELNRDGEPELSVVEGEAVTLGQNPIQLGFTFNEREELLRAFDILKEDGIVKLEICELPWSPCAAEVVDRFGVWWFLTLPMHRP